MKQKFYRSLIELTNGVVISKILKRFAQSRFSRLFIKSYARMYDINLEEVLDDPKTFKSLHEFFTRKLHADIRPIDQEKNTVTSPVDGVLEEYGEIELDSLITIKGKVYSISEMLGGIDKAAKYKGGHFLIIYLSPAHYHRIHSPITGQVTNQYELGGKSYPVNRLGLKYGDQVLSKNFRIISELTHGKSRMSIVKIGAMFINSIVIVQPEKEWKKGEEVAYFSFGSTVVLLFEKGTFHFEKRNALPAEVKMGETLGRLLI